MSDKPKTGAQIAAEDMAAIKDMDVTWEDINSTPDQPKEVYTYRFDVPIIIVPIGDIHIGNNTSNRKLFAMQCKYILDTPNCYTVVIGDVIENATKHSVGAGVYEQNMTPQQQQSYIIAMLKPIKDRILGVIMGNHEIRSWFTSGVNLPETISEMIGVKYLGYQGFLNLVVEGKTYSVMLYHGRGGGSTPGGKLNSVVKLNRVANMDLYISGHIHKKLYDQDQIFYAPPGTKHLVSHKRHYVAIGSSLEYFTGYAEMQALPPSQTGFVRIHINAKGIKVDV